VNPSIKKSKIANQKSQINHPAIVGFLLPFLAAGTACACVLYGGGNLATLFYKAVFFVFTPLILAAGLFSSLRSIPLIPERGDRDYAYSGLVLNIFFILLYLSSVIYALLRFAA
jgi:hypothetical protein